MTVLPYYYKNIIILNYFLTEPIVETIFYPKDSEIG